MTNPKIPSFTPGIPDGDDRLRNICDTCGFVDYMNPRIVAGSVVTKDDKVLLCKRAIEPRKGFWTLPAGYMELGETVEEAAMREAREEACAEIRLQHMLAVYSVPRIGQVHIMFRAHLESDIDIGPESEEVSLFAWKDIPWRELAFPTVAWALTHFSETRNQSGFTPFGNPAGTAHITN